MKPLPNRNEQEVFNSDRVWLKYPNPLEKVKPHGK